MKTKINIQKTGTIFFLVILPILIFYLMEWFLRNPFEKMRFPIQLLNMAFFELAALLLFFMTDSVRIAIRIEALLAFIIGIANYFVVQFRSNPIMPWDIFSIRTAASVADNYQYTLKPHAIVCVVLFLLILIGSFFIPKQTFLGRKIRLGGSICSMIMLILLTVYVQSPQAVHTFRLYDKLFTPNTMTYKDGTIVAFLMECQYLSVDTPKSYSEQKAKELLVQASDKNQPPVTADTDSFSEKTDNIPVKENSTDPFTPCASVKELPNIIVIMNEAFSDLSILGDYTTNENEIPYIRSLMEKGFNTISGYMDVSVLGGNTANTEFEFLTGNTMAFLPQGCIPYQQYVHEPADSLASVLKDNGYRTIAMHPYYATGWDRNEVYAHFGFDSFYSLEDFSNPVLYRKYVSDKSDIEKVIELYEEDPDTPLFLFNVTMQNHSSYSDIYENFTPEIKVDGTDSASLNQYLSLLKESDQALEELIYYFERIDDPTIIVFFGDHQPTDSVVSPIYKLNEKSVSSLTEEELRLRYQVPYIIHANFDIPQAQNVPMSANYLGIKTLELAGLPLTDYQQYLARQYREYPSVSVLQITDSMGNTYSSDMKEELLTDYQILQYYHLFQ